MTLAGEAMRPALLRPARQRDGHRNGHGNGSRLVAMPRVEQGVRLQRTRGVPASARSEAHGRRVRGRARECRTAVSPIAPGAADQAARPVVSGTGITSAKVESSIRHAVNRAHCGSEGHQVEV